MASLQVSMKTFSDTLASIISSDKCAKLCGHFLSKQETENKMLITRNRNDSSVVLF